VFQESEAGASSETEETAASSSDAKRTEGPPTQKAGSDTPKVVDQGQALLELLRTGAALPASALSRQGENGESHGLLKLLRQGDQESSELRGKGKGKTGKGKGKGKKSRGPKEPEHAGLAEMPAESPEGWCATSAGHYPTSLTAMPWEPLVRPILDGQHPKAFVGASVFARKGGGISVAEAGSRPQVLVERRDRGIMVMFKPSGWATCSTPHWEGNEGNLIRHVWKHFNVPTAAPCHRLDKGTSGIVVCATNKSSSKHICEQIVAKTLVKQYVGLCHGRVREAAGAFSAPLALSATDKPLGTCSLEGREAVTRFRVLGYFARPDGAGYTLLQVQIDHGRQHQIRLHMASLGHPLVSDPKYNSAKSKEDAQICPRLFLHACFLKCLLPPGEDGDAEELFTVACRLPAELKHTLNTTLSWHKNPEGIVVPLEAYRLCECLLGSEMFTPKVNGDGECLHASRLVVRRRDDFLHRFGFNEQERAEVNGILALLPTAEERSAALQQFRVLGQRTPDFIVGRFQKYVEGLLRWRKQRADEAAAEEGEAAADDSQASTSDSAALVEGSPVAGSSDSSSQLPEDTAKVDPLTQVPGPVRIHAETVWCDVCGQEERMVCLQVPLLSVRLRVPRAKTPGCFQELARACDDWHSHAWQDVGKEPGKAVKDASRSGAKRGPTTEWPEEEWVAEAEWPEEEWVDHEWLLQEDVRRMVAAAAGGELDGFWVAGKVSARFNAHVRTNSKRNDGSLRRWIAATPGISVESCGTNRWKVLSA